MTTTVTQQHWDADADAADDEDCFFESLDRVPSSISIGLDVASSASESDEDDDVRVSFASAVGPPSCFRKTKLDFADGRGGGEGGGGGGYDYGIWMAEPMSIQERRRLLLHGMGLTSSKNLRRDPSRAIARGHSSLGIQQQPQQQQQQEPQPPPPPPPQQQQQTSSSPTPSTPLSVPRSRSYNWTAPSSLHSALLRSYSEPPSLWDRLGDHPRGGSANGDGGGGSCGAGDGDDGRGALSSRPLGLCRIKNLDTGKEFVVSELRKDGSWSRLNDLQTGHQLTVEEFEKGLGYSSIVKEVMRRVNLGTSGGSNGTLKQPRSAKSSSKSRIGSHRKKGGWLKNIMSATGLMSDKDKGVSAKASSSPPSTTSSSSSELMKVRQHGKPYKELTGLYMCQEIQAHRGSIWTIKFSSDARYLASAGEDRIVHVWQALERCTSAAPSLSSSSSSLARSDMSHQPSQHPDGSPDRPPGLASEPSKRTRKGLVPFGSARRSLPDNIVMPGTIFSLSDKPLCSFHGHLDDVLDLSWSKSQHLLSSSMDKTVRLWDVETKTCLKLFAHNDYVTCIQFNPVDDEYFISGSLDAKVRIWSISDRQVVDWCDLHEMVTAACYTPDGQGAFVGSHKGTCRFYNTSDGRLCQEGQIDIRTKKKKSNAKKVTGFQFAPDNASEVLITSADSQIRVFDGFDMIHKFRGFRNTSSQISASFTSDGKYVVCASEDSNVYIWKTQVRNVGSGGRSKGWVTTRSHEHFPCRDISVAIPWPGSGGGNHRPATLAGGQSDANNNQHPSLRCSDSQRSTSVGEDVFHSSTSLKCPPPLPKKGSMTEHTLPCADDLGCPSRSGSGMGSPSASPSLQPGALVPASTPSSSSSSSSWGWYGGSTNKASSCSEEASAWGLVIVTAGLGGDIRVYRNFGLPVRLSRQTNLF